MWALTEAASSQRPCKAAKNYIDSNMAAIGVQCMAALEHNYVV